MSKADNQVRKNLPAFVSALADVRRDAKRTELTPLDVSDACKELANKIRLSGYRPDLIVGILEGGWVVAMNRTGFPGGPNV
jgi:hypothetical protein